MVNIASSAGVGTTPYGSPEYAAAIQLVHAVTNGAAIGVYAASWLARRQGRHDTGARLALVGAAVSGVGAYLGGHLAAGRAVATRHPAYVDSPVA